MNKNYKYFSVLSMLFMTVKLITILLIYKIIIIGPFKASCSTIIMPFWFFLGDIIAEVYGYKAARQLILITMVCQFIFAFVCYFAIKLPSPDTWLNQSAYDVVLGNLPRVSSASFIAVFFGSLLNVHLLVKWKILLRGRYFWLRCLCASAIGEFIFTVIAYVIEFFGITTLHNINELITISYLIKLICSPILIIPSTIAVYYIKKGEGANLQDNYLTFDPFKLKEV